MHGGNLHRWVKASTNHVMKTIGHQHGCRYTLQIDLRSTTESPVSCREGLSPWDLLFGVVFDYLTHFIYLHDTQ